jgi:hypothetical protein
MLLISSPASTITANSEISHANKEKSSPTKQIT